MKYFAHFFVLVLLSLPLFVSAQTSGYSNLDFAGLVGKAVEIINQIVPVLMSLATFLLLAGVVRYILTLGDSDSHQSALKLILWGTFGLFIMVSVWGLVNLGVSILGLSGGGSPCTGGFCD